MIIKRLDHIVLTVRDIETSFEFYSRTFGVRILSLGDGRRSILFGDQKISLHQEGLMFKPKPAHPTPGSADLCLIVETPLNDVINHLNDSNIEIILGPVRRHGAQNLLISIYINDPDKNIIEIANEVT
ncbi:MAG: VOC family protein [Candidatus Hodarchaeales archaeon]